MVTNDEGIASFRHKVIEEVARLAWNDELEDDYFEKLVYKLIPGPKASYRCCIYKERELVRQRIRLAMGKCPTPEKDERSKNVIQVLDPACDECPIASYVVTDNCRLCMGKACLNSCPFGAISVGRDRTYIDPSKYTPLRTSDVVQQLANQFQAIRNQITDMTVGCHEDTEFSVEKSLIDGGIHLEFGLIRGPQGEPGTPGSAGAPGSPGPKGDPFTYADFTDAQLEALRGEDGKGIVSISKT